MMRSGNGWTVLWGEADEVLAELDEGSVDLVYMDPPFFTGRNFRQFDDRWRNMDEYVAAMSVVAVACHRVLAEEGAFYLHCDETASHYLKVMLDGVFGFDAFRAEITWRRTAAHNDKVFANVTDKILFYGPSPRIKGDIRRAWTPEEVESRYNRLDERGRYFTSTLDGPDKHGTGNGREAWRGCAPPEGRLWSVPRRGEYAAWIEREAVPGYRSIDGAHNRLDALDAAGLIHWAGPGKAMLKVYHYPGAGVLPSNLWTDIAWQRNGEYPTQKPVELLERIVLASSERDALVLDPCCGSGTTGVAALKHGRRFVGVDRNTRAVQLAGERLATTSPSLL